MNKEETIFKIRTDKQLERLNYLLCFKSKSAIAEMLIDTEEIITRAIEYIKKYKQIYDVDGTEENMLDEFNILASPKTLLKILGGDVDDNNKDS